MHKLRLPALGGSFIIMAFIVGALFALPNEYTCSISAQETTCMDLIATNDALQVENLELKATLESQNQSMSPVNACYRCLEDATIRLTELSLTLEPSIFVTPDLPPGALIDDFTNDLGHLELGNVGQVAEGELMVTTDMEQSYVRVYHNVNQPLQITVQARLSIQALLEDQTAINILYGDIVNRNYVYIRIQKDYITVSQVQGKEEQFLQSLSVPDMELDWSQYQNIKINFQENLGLYINDQLLGLSNYLYTGNQIALGLQYFGVAGSSSVYFDNLQIIPLEP